MALSRESLFYTYPELVKRAIPLGTAFVRRCFTVLTYAVAQPPGPWALASTAAMVELDVLSRLCHACSSLGVLLGTMGGVSVFLRQAVAAIRMRWATTSPIAARWVVRSARRRISNRDRRTGKLLGIGEEGRGRG
jgi:hypothetical protein